MSQRYINHLEMAVWRYPLSSTSGILDEKLGHNGSYFCNSAIGNNGSYM